MYNTVGVTNLMSGFSVKRYIDMFKLPNMIYIKECLASDNQFYNDSFYVTILSTGLYICQQWKLLRL